MRRIFALLAALTLIFSMAAAVSAEEVSPALVLDVEQTGSGVVVEVSLEGCAGVTNGHFVLGYDADVLAVTEVRTTDAYAMYSVNDAAAGEVAFAWVGSELTAEKTGMVTLVLEVTGVIDGDMNYTAAAEGIYADTQAVEVADASVTVEKEQNPEPVVDTAALEQAVEAAAKLTGEGCTEGSFAAVEAALKAAKAVLADPDCTQEQVDAALSELEKAVAGLVDISKLETAVKNASSLKADAYTEASFVPFKKALDAAKKVLSDKNATQKAVDDALSALNKAIAGLRKLGTVTPGTGDESGIGVWIAVLGVSFVAMIAAIVLMVLGGKKGGPGSKGGKKSGQKRASAAAAAAKKGGRFLSMFLVTVMVITMVPANAFAAVVDGQEQEIAPTDKGAVVDQFVKENTEIAETPTEEIFGGVKELDKLDADLKLEQTQQQVAPYGKSEIVRIIVELEGDCLLDQGYTQTQINQFGTRVEAVVESMEERQLAVAEEIGRLIAESGLVPTMRSASVKYHYTAALNGMAMEVPYGILPAIRQLEGVKGAYTVTRYDVPDKVEPTYETNMYATSEHFGSAQTWHELGYAGEGMVVAILDTGLDLDHPSFAATPEGARLTLSDVEKVLTQLNAYSLYEAVSAVPLTADRLYRSGKVPYAFNYVDNSLDATHDYDDQGDHGTHVAGTVAANPLDSTSVVGVAPNAQLVIMKVFGQNGGAYSDDIIAAIEDCVLMDIDVINMSLGAPAGFSEESYLINEVYGRILKTDMVLAIAAGNANSAASGNNLGTNRNLTVDPDNGLVNSPATYLASTIVASLENTAMMMPYFSVDENKIPYVDVTYFNFAKLAGTHEYVVIPGVGEGSDYEGLDVSGKVALVQRGTIDFAAKQAYAFEAGAVAMVCYDNVHGDLISMYDAGLLPNVFISKASGEILLAAAENGVGTLVIQPYGTETAVPNSVAGLLSDFSCWGVTPDLQLSPDVTAPGGNIYSTLTDGAYGTMSGTSMACPHIAGMSALVLQYLHDQYPGLAGEQYHIIAESLVMCTAVPAVDPDGILYSPRKQGAGAANVYSAISSPVYLTSYQKATGELTPKGSLGDDPARTGVFTFAFTMHNLTDAPQQYMLDGDLLTDQFLVIDGLEFMGETGRNLSGSVICEIPNKEKLSWDVNGDGITDKQDVQYLLDTANGVKTMDPEAIAKFDLLADGVITTVDAQLLYRKLQESYEAENLVTVPANGSVTVNVTVALSAEDKAYMEAHYPNGIYVDGFVRAYAQSEGAVDLSLPFVGFYGDWTDARMFDNGWYYDAEATDADPDNDDYYNRYLNVVFATLGDYESSFGGLGINPYLVEAYDPAHNVLSPNGDMYFDYVPDIYISLLRSAELLDFTWTDDATGEQLFYEWYAYARKSYYWSAYGMCLPAIYSDADCLPFTMLDENGELLVEDLQHLTLTIRGYLDDGDLDALEVDAQGNPLPNLAWVDDEAVIPVVIDLQAPTMDVSSIRYFTENGRNYVSFNVEDNYDIAAVVAMTNGGGSYEYVPVTTKQPGVDGEKDTVTLDITDYDASFQVALCDYGCNESYYELSNQFNTGLASDTFYGFRRYSTITSDSAIYATDQLNGWYSFQTADVMQMHTSQPQTREATVYAAEYVDGYVFGAQAGPDGSNTLFVMQAGAWDRTQLGSDRAMNMTVYEWPGRDETYFPLKMIALDMTYDYTSGTMYILANALENSYFPEGEINILLSMDLTTGAVKVLGKIFAENDDSFLALTLACDSDGQLYCINYENGKLYTVDSEPVETTSGYGYGTYMAKRVENSEKTQYYPALYSQSMTFDHATGKLYWAGYQGKTGIAYFIELDKTTGEFVTITMTEHNAEMVGLMKPWHGAVDIIPCADLAGITLNSGDLYLAVGQNHTLRVLPQPYNAQLGEVTWTSSDPSVARVSEYGIVEAVGIGACTITAQCGNVAAKIAVNVSAVSGTAFAYSGDNWLMLDVGAPEDALQIADAMVLEGTVTAAAYLQDCVYATAVEESYDADGNTAYTTNFYKLDANTLSGIKLSSFPGKITALAFNYADGFLYGLNYAESYDARYNATITYTLVRLNLSTGQTLEVTDLNDIFLYTDKGRHYNTCSGALAIDYEGNFYVNGDNSDTYKDNVLVRFNLDENDTLVNAVFFPGFEDYNWQGDAMVWSQSNNGLFRVSGTELSWVDVSDMAHVVSISLGDIRSQSGHVIALVMPLTNEPELPAVIPTAVYLEESYTVPQGETVRALPTFDPWNATAQVTYTTGDSGIATVDENGVITGVAMGETTVTVTIPGTQISATATVTVVKNPGSLIGFAQADIAAGVPLNSWIKMPLANTGNGVVIAESPSFTVYAAEYYNGDIYAYAQSETDSLYYFLRLSAGNFRHEILAQGDILVRDMAFDYTTGTMYAIGYTDVVHGGLYQMDLDTGRLTLVADNDKGVALVTLACDNEGTLYTADENGRLYTMNREDGCLTDTGIRGEASPYLQSMTYDWNNDAIFWAKGGSIHSVDVENGTLTYVGLADMDSGELETVGCVVSGLFSVPLEAPPMPETVDPAGVVADARNTVAVGHTVRLDAVVLPVSVAAMDRTVRWSSGDDTIATVDASGVITGVAPGEVYIFAADALGHEAAVLVTVTEQPRLFYGYDALSRSWISFGADGQIVNTWADEEGLSPIVAAQYVGEILYAYDAEGYFYTVDTETFQRTKLGEGIHGMTVDLEAWDKSHDGNVYYVEDVPYRMVDMAHSDSGEFYAVMMAYNISEWRDSFSYKIVEISPADGSVIRVIAADALVDNEMSLRPANLIWRGGDLYTVNGYITGMVTKIDVNTGELTGGNIFASYWGDFNGGRSMVEDPITGEVYAIRDMRTDYIGMPDYTDAYATSELCTVSLVIARCDAMANVGTNVRLVGLFIK